MIPASAEYLTYEAQNIGAMPAVRATFLPYFWPNGIADAGEFSHCVFAGPGRIQADYEGFTGGYWISDPLTSNLQIPSSNAVITYTWNYPGYTGAFYYRGGRDLTELAAADWTLITSGATIQIYPYYQFKLTLDGYRAWAIDDPGDADDFTAWAEDTPNEDEYQGYAADANVSGDPLAYIDTVEILGEFTIYRDIEEAGSVTVEVPSAFDDLVAGAHSGLLLNNRQGSFVGGVWVPAPVYSHNKSSFFLSQQNWYGLKLKIELGWYKGGWFGQEWGEDEWFGEEFTEFITLFIGKVTKWGPVNCAVDQNGKDQPANVEVYAKDWISECLQKRICLPAADGSPTPLTFGEFLCEAEPISGWTPAPLYKSALFESGDLLELSSINGAITIITPGLTDTYSMRATATGANQYNYGTIELPTTEEVFITGTIRFTSMPGTITNRNMDFIQLKERGGGVLDRLRIFDNILENENLQSDFDITAYEGVPLDFSYWYYAGSNTRRSRVKLWINNEEIIDYEGGFTLYLDGYPSAVRFGAVTGATAENWTIDFDNLKVYLKYYNFSYVVYGYPFDSIGSVFVDMVSQPAWKDVAGYDQIITRYPQYGMVQFNNPENGTYVNFDPDFKAPGGVMMRVIEHLGGRHPLTVIESLIAAAGLTEYLDATSLAAAWAAVPNDSIHARFDGGTAEKRGLKDYASMGIPIAEALKEICSRCLYWIFADCGVIKIVPYTGIPPTSPVMAIAGNLREAAPIIDLENINSFVSAVYGWYDRNPSLFYLTGNQEAGGQGTALDFTWNSPVACEGREMVKAKVDLLYKFLSAQERLDPVRLNLAGARLELMEPVSVNDELLSDAAINYWVTRKEVGLDFGGLETSLQLIRFLGE